MAVLHGRRAREENRGGGCGWPLQRRERRGAEPPGFGGTERKRGFSRDRGGKEKRKRGREGVGLNGRFKIRARIDQGSKQIQNIKWFLLIGFKFRFLHKFKSKVRIFL